MSFIIVHGHFYQPPRENPWTDAIDHQPSAAPFHDWNERVHAESYRPNTLANIVTPEGERTVSNYERMSFDIGPTLMRWLQRVHPKTYSRIQSADRSSAQRLGHGNAIAQSYHHTILPLSPLHDVRTEVAWGLADFRHRFEREAEGMWLPETAASNGVLDVLIDEGVAFTILAPHQAARWRRDGGPWTGPEHSGMDTRVPYRRHHSDGSGRFISVFLFDADIARAIAFERATSSAERLIDLFTSREPHGARVVHTATDGETYGHHHVFGDIGLAYALYVEAARRGVEATNYAAHLERFPAQAEVEIVAGEGTSWSCAHGVGRWKEDCGCHTGGEEGWNQAWRGPLRSALDLVKRAADETFDAEGRLLFDDPWEARNHYVAVVTGAQTIEGFLAQHSSARARQAARLRAQTLLELQRSAMAMFTSCAWFFSDVSGIETVQILRYAARVLDLLEALQQPLPTRAFLTELSTAKSNDARVGTAADLFESVARP